MDFDAEIDGVRALAALRGIVLEIVLASTPDGIGAAISREPEILSALTLPPEARLLLSLADDLMLMRSASIRSSAFPSFFS